MKPIYILLIVESILGTNYSQEIPDEIIFYSNGSTFSPLVYIEGNATILWTFDDSTTNSLPNPIKNYGFNQIRMNRLKVTPWNTLVGINLGYGGEDSGSDTILIMPGQEVSKVENLNLVAPYLKLWCSSYNMIDSLNFNDFINLETIEYYNSTAFQYISLENTTNLKRLCAEENVLQTLDLSGCTALQDIRVSMNDLTDMIFRIGITQFTRICFRDNPQITNPTLFSNMENYPLISELFIKSTNQNGILSIHRTFDNSINFMAHDNYYTTIDFLGAFQDETGWAEIHLANNIINTINIDGCDQIKHLDLNPNNLSSESVDDVLQNFDGFGTTNGYIDLRGNATPTSIGFAYASSLEAKNWIVLTDGATLIDEDSSFTPFNFELSQNYPNPFNPETKIRYQLPIESKVVIKIFNILGSEVLELVNEKKDAGAYEVNFNGENLSCGIYLYKIITDNFIETKKMTLLK